MKYETFKNFLILLIGLSVIFIIGMLGFVIMQFWNSTHITQEDITNAENLYNQALQQIENKEYSKALQQLDEAIKLNPLEEKYYAEIIKIYTTKNRYDLVLSFVDTIREDIKNKPQIAELYGFSLCKEQQYDKCVSVLEEMNVQSIGLDTKIELLKAYLELKQIDKAQNISQLLDSSSIGCSNKKEYDLIVLSALAWGTSYQKVDDYLSICSDSNIYEDSHKAFEEYQNASDEYKADYSSRLLVAYANIAANYDLWQYMQYLLNEVPDEYANNFWEWLYLYGLSFYRLNKNDEAIDYLERSIAINSYHYHPYWVLANIYSDDNNVVKAEEYFKTALLVSGEKAEVLLNYLEWTVRNNQFTSASSVFHDISDKCCINDNLDIDICVSAISVYSKSNSIDIDTVINTINDLLSNNELSSLYIEELVAYKVYILYNSNDNNLNDIDVLDNPQTAFGWYANGVLNYVSGEYEKAKTDLERAIDIGTEGEVIDMVEEILHLLN